MFATYAGVATLVVALVTALLAATPAQAVDEVNTKRLRNAVTVGGILSHERVFQRIANQNGGTRASGTPRVRRLGRLRRRPAARRRLHGHEQEFVFPFYRELSPAVLEQVSPTPTTYVTGTFDFSGTGDVTGVVVPTNDLVIPPTPEPSSTPVPGPPRRPHACLTPRKPPPDLSDPQ